MSRPELLKAKLEDVLVSKMEEMHMLGYESISTEEIWQCVTERYKDQWPLLHKIVNDIYSLKPTTLMNWLTIHAYQGKIDIGKNSLV